MRTKWYAGEDCEPTGTYRQFSDRTGKPLVSFAPAATAFPEFAKTGIPRGHGDSIMVAGRRFPPTEENHCWRCVENFVRLWVSVPGDEETVQEVEAWLLTLEGGHASFARNAAGDRVQAADGAYEIVAVANAEYTRYALTQRGYVVRDGVDA